MVYRWWISTNCKGTRQWSTKSKIINLVVVYCFNCIFCWRNVFRKFQRVHYQTSAFVLQYSNSHYNECAVVSQSSKIYGKKMLKYVPILGWAWAFSEVIFLERNWEKDKPAIMEAMENLSDFPLPVWVSRSNV